MSMMYFSELALPKNPINPIAFEQFVEERNAEQGNHNERLNFKNVTDLLTDECNEAFENIGLKPRTAVLFGKEMSADQRFFVTPCHRDVESRNGKWNPVSCAVNWEMTKGGSIMDWFEETVQPDTDPSADINNIQDYYQDVYVYSSGLPNKIDSCKLKNYTPYLMRTDTPHQLKFIRGEERRYSLSVRFYEESAPDWQTVWDKFKPIILRT